MLLALLGAAIVALCLIGCSATQADVGDIHYRSIRVMGLLDVKETGAKTNTASVTIGGAKQDQTAAVEAVKALERIALP